MTRNCAAQLIDTLFKLGTIYRRTQQGKIVPSLSVISIRSGKSRCGLMYNIVGAKKTRNDLKFIEK